MDGVRLGDVVASGQRLVVPAIAEGNGKQGVSATHRVLPGGHRRALRRNSVTALDHPHAAGFGAGATDQQGTQGKANHQSLKACCTYTLRNDCETHPPLPLWWLKHERLYQA